MFRSFHYFNYRVWFAGWLVSNLGAWMQRTAQDWLVLTELTDANASALGLATALQFVPQLALVGVAGTIADRFPKRRVIFVCQLLLALLGLILAVLTLSGVLELWMLFALALGIGLVTAFDMPARQSFVSELVARPDLPNAVALNSSTLNLARLVGPALAGLLIVPVGVGVIFVLNVASFVGMLTAVLVLRGSELVPIPRAAGKRGGFVAGLQYIRSRPDAMVVIIVMFVFGAFGVNLPLVVATMARVEFDANATVFGILASAVAVGAVCGGLIAARRKTVQLRHIVWAGAGYFAAVLVAVFIPDVWPFAAILAVAGFFTQLIISSSNTYVQLVSPLSYRGRVIAVFMAVFLGANMIGAPLIGFIADTFGVRWSLLVNSMSGAVMALIVLIWCAVSLKGRLAWDRSHKWPIRVEIGRPLPEVDESGEQKAPEKTPEQKAADEKQIEEAAQLAEQEMALTEAETPRS